jgi:sugar lactone lactonase YvrE
MEFSSQRDLRRLRVAVLLIGAATGVRGDVTSPQSRNGWHRHEIDAIAPVSLVGSGFADLSGVAAEASGALLITDRVAGTLSRIHTSGESEVVLRDLHRPRGVATNALGEVFVLEAGAGRILHVRENGSSVVAVDDLRQPRGLAIGPDATMWTAAQGRGGDSVVRIEPSGGVTEVISGFPAVRALAVTGSALLIATGTSVWRMNLHADGSVGSPTSIVARWHSSALIVDRLEDVYIGGWPVGGGGAARAGILKYDSESGRTTRFATGVRQPAALGLEASGHLLAAEGSPHGRLWRFVAPPAPEISLPAFTSQTSIVVTGTADRGSRVHAFADDTMQAIVMADEVTGRFTMTCALAPSSDTTLVFVATGAGGAGLAGPPVTRLIVHDDSPPRVTLTSPAAAAYVRDTVVIAANAMDERSSMASIRFLLDDIAVGGAEAAGGESHLAAEAVVDVGRTAEGMHTLTAVATDGAGNEASAAQLVVIDRTPPDTLLVEHPEPDITETAATFTFAATDIFSPAVEFSWRLDAAEWSPYQAGTSAALERLEAGKHVFEVRARDLAGNEDVTPPRWEFQVRAVHVDVAEPAAGSVVTTSTVWVRGNAGGAPPVTVSIPLPPDLRVLASIVSAPVVNGRFAVEMPLLPGKWSIAVTATDGGGATATQAVEVLVQDAVRSPSRARAVPSAGFAPHSVQFGVASLPVGTYTIDLESDGTLEYSGDRPDGRPFTYVTPGAFLATIAAVTSDGASLQWRSAVTAYDRNALEIELRAAWNGLKDALRRGEADEAAAFVHTRRRDVWRGYFAELVTAAASDLDAIFTEIDVLGFEGDQVECEMMRAVDGLMFSFPVSFAMDTDGRWRLWQF